MSPPVNVIRIHTGKLCPACEFCGRIGRAATPTLPSGRLSIFDVADGWAVVRYPPDVTHPDGSTGDLWRCPTCRGRLERGEVLTPDAGRGAR
jgi:hypothetical protein